MPANVCDEEHVVLKEGECFGSHDNIVEEYEEDEIKAALCALSTLDDSSNDEASPTNYDADDDDDESNSDECVNIELQIEDEAVGVTPEEYGAIRAAVGDGELQKQPIIETSSPVVVAANKLVTYAISNGGDTTAVTQGKGAQQLVQFTNNSTPMYYVQYIPMAQAVPNQSSEFIRSFHHFMPYPTQATAALPPNFQAVKAPVQEIAVGDTPPENIDEDNIPLAQISKVRSLRDDAGNMEENNTQVVHKPHKCKSCNIRFQWMSHLRRHEKTHSNEKYMCNICHAGFSQFGYFKAHRRSHFAEKPYKCDKCEKRFVQSTHLKIHMMIHTGEKPYECPVCKARFTQHGNLKRHIRTHTGERPYKCSICPASFTHSSDLTRHLRIHTGERPYKCQFCATAFATNGNLKSHLKIHTSRKAYKCTVCKASFNVESYLKAHMRTHTGERPYVCTCGESFTQGLSFKFHLRARMTSYCGDVSQ